MAATVKALSKWNDYDCHAYRGGNGAGRGYRNPRGLVTHVNQSPAPRPSWWQTNTGAYVTPNWEVKRDGTLELYLPPGYMPWCQSAGNPEWDAVETEGYDREPFTDAQCATLAKLYADYFTGAFGFRIPAQFATTPAGSGIGTHAMGGKAWGGHPCPGAIRTGQIPGLVNTGSILGGIIMAGMTDAQITQLFGQLTRMEDKLNTLYTRVWDITGRDAGMGWTTNGYDLADRSDKGARPVMLASELDTSFVHDRLRDLTDPVTWTVDGKTAAARGDGGARPARLATEVTVSQAVIHP